MAILKPNCGLWTKTEDANSIEYPEIGSGGVIYYTPTYPAAKFGNGFNSHNTRFSPPHFRYPRNNVGFDPNVWAVEFWIDTNTWTVTDGIPSDATTHRFWDWYVNDNNRVTIFQSSAAFTFAVVVGGNTSRYDPTTGITYDSSLRHVLHAFDRNGIDGGADTLRFYLDGVKIGYSSISPANQTTSGGNVGFQSGYFGGGVQWSFSGTFDNVKLYTTVSEALITAILNNRNNEGWPVASRARIRIN